MNCPVFLKYMFFCGVSLSSNDATALNSRGLPTGGAAVAGADSGAGEEAPCSVGTRGFPGGSAMERLHCVLSRRSAGFFKE